MRAKRKTERGSRDATLDEMVLEALEEVLEPGAAAEALSFALAAEHLPAVPRQPAAARFFVTGALRRVVVDHLGIGAFDAIARELGARIAEEAVARRRSFRSGTRYRPPGEEARELDTQPPPAPEAGVARLLVVSLDPRTCAALERRLPAPVRVSRAESLFDFAPLLELSPDDHGAVIIDAALTPLALPTLARMAHVIPAVCPVVVVGLSREAWSRLRALEPGVEGWHLAERFEDLAPETLFPASITAPS